MLGTLELLVILFIIILIFGAKRLAGLGSGLGQAILGFKREMRDADEPAKPDDRRGDGRPDKT